MRAPGVASLWLAGSFLWSAHPFSFLSNNRHATRRRTLLLSSNPSPSDSTADATSSSSTPPLSSAAPSKLSDIRMEFKLHTSIDSILAVDWDTCVHANTCSRNETAVSPFLKHSWMHALEVSQCASAAQGWVPQHLSIHWNGQCYGYVPLYLKGNSMGEFIFDNEWAQAAYQNNIDYYPKLLVAVPFTPVSGCRILWHPTIYQNYNDAELAELRVCVGTFLKQSARANQLSSVHFNFVSDQEATDLSQSALLGDDSNDKKDNSIRRLLPSLFGSSVTKDDYLRRTSLQYHWKNANPNNNDQPYESFDEYLSCFKSKRRINIRRERRKVLEDEKIVIQAVTGREILQVDGLVERMFEIYLSTIDKMYWGRQYLTLDFFLKLAASDFIDNLCFMCARYESSGKELHARDVFAGTFNVLGDGVFYGRYWGCLAGAEVKNLHFETCYWSAIDYCIANGFKRMEPGAGGGDYKWARGFDPALIHSVHYICHFGLRRAVSQFLDYETENNVELTEYLLEKSAVGSKAATDKQ